MIKRILVGLAGTPYTDTAIRRAVELAKVHEAELTGPERAFLATSQGALSRLERRAVRGRRTDAAQAHPRVVARRPRW